MKIATIPSVPAMAMGDCRRRRAEHRGKRADEHAGGLVLHRQIRNIHRSA
jgi:hypothetical protein